MYVTIISSWCCKCRSGDAAYVAYYVASVSEACCKCLFKKFHLFPRRMLQAFWFECCICFHIYVATVYSKIFHLFQSSIAASVFMLQVASVLSGCCICFHTYVARVCSKYFTCFRRMLQVFSYCKLQMFYLVPHHLNDLRPTRGWSGCLKEYVKILLKMLTGWFQIDLAYCSVLNSWLKLLPSLLAYILTVAGLKHHVCITYSAIRSSSLHRLLCNSIFTAPILW
jgi:hypothetical protein